MRSQIFKNAWLIKKETKVSLSEALKTAWKAFKLNIRVIVTVSWQKVKTVCYSAKKGTSTYTNDSLDKLIFTLSNHKDNNSKGAQFDYGFGLYNGD